MTRTRPPGLLGLMCCLAFSPVGSLPAHGGSAPTGHIVVTPEVLNPVDDRLFGQFLEVASWDEPGPDAVADERTGELPEAVVELLEWMQIPVIRWPGGTDISSIDWTDRVDGVPSRNGEPRTPTKVGDNTISNRFGHDAFLRLCERLGAEPLMVLNLKDLLAGKRTVDEATRHAAAFVAYCNAPTDADLDPELLAWARLRVTNGRAQPWRVPYFQIGNETFFFVRQLAEAAGHDDPEAQADWLAEHVVAVAQAMKAVDPTIKIIYDGDLGGEPKLTGHFYDDPRVRAWIDFPTLHSYYPMNDYVPWRDGDALGPDDLSLEQLWYLWQFGPGHWVDGDLVATAPGWRYAQIEGPLAHTEWNWNGWGDKLGIRDHPRKAAVASAVAVAAHLNGMIRQGDRFVIGNQSMLVGTKWNISAVRADPAGVDPPFLSPTGLATGLFSRLHGDRRLRVAVESMPTTDAVAGIEVRAYGNARNPGTPAFPLLDVVATADDRHLYLHVAHRSFSETTRLSVDLRQLDAPDGPAEVHLITAKDADTDAAAERPALDAMVYTVVAAEVHGGEFHVDLPPGSVAIIRISHHAELAQVAETGEDGED